MAAEERPLNPTEKAVFDRAEIGREDISAVLEAALEAESSAMRLFPDFYVHRLTAAIIKAGLVEPYPDIIDPNPEGLTP